MDRIILHCDLNCFYASVELLSHPDLRDVPMAVCGDPTSRHGIILAKNEPAKKYGVQTAETIWQAKKKCPDLVLLPPHHALYREYSRKVNAIYDEYTDLVEPFGIDESWLDITHTIHLFGGDPKALADALRERMKRELGLTLSVGISFNKVFAKLGSDYKKPDATTVISRENWQEIVWPLPVGTLLYVGGAAQRLLKQYGVETIGQLAACKPEMLESLMGKLGSQLYEYANGLSQEPVRSRYDAEPVKSVGNGTTFPKNLKTRAEVQSGIAMLADSVATRLRHYGLYASGIQVTIRDPEFRDRSRQQQLAVPTHLIRDLTDHAMALVDQLWRPPSPIRALTVTAIHLVQDDQAYEQVDLFTAAAAPKKEKQEKLEAAMDRIRGKYGTGAIIFGAAQPEKEEDPLP
ncbi:DNA polymerase IV [uncultured Dysosmobacter sp.]|uniref:DNA polymerase IV n=1 Tax=uncultured Dysosmobacter sp. TaxID=2591384 RepID=UPI0026212A30|nr:DNA polymerase IV [uncultured Dysosmobacter sp.]